jgi:hypothetical protein
MPERHPTYPVYVISKGRATNCTTPRFLERDGVRFKLVVEPCEAAQYLQRFPAEQVLVAPEDFHLRGLGGTPVRNYVWEHALASGARRHWIIDDNIHGVCRRMAGLLVSCTSRLAMVVAETFVDRYENIALASLHYSTFITADKPYPPFHLNHHNYSYVLVRNDLDFRWRGGYNEDTDLSLQALARNWCTVVFNAFTCNKTATMTMRGGNTTTIYRGDGRLKMARWLERNWPYFSRTIRRWRRPQHSIGNRWGKFDTPLIRRADVPWAELPAVDEFGMVLKELEPVQSRAVQYVQRRYRELTGGGRMV